MGLDMYLERMPRYDITTPSEISAIESYFDWKKERRENGYKGTLKKWCGVDYKNVPKGDVLKFYEQHCKYGYADWDTEHKYTGRYRIIEQVGYWRKANQIHNWFVNNVQDGVDDCRYHNEVTREDLELLLATCKAVLSNCKLIDGKICNGQTVQDGEWVDILVDGKIIEDSSVAERLLPSTSGFFFGNTDYNQYYVEDIESTIDIITKVLETTDFETQMIYYVSSW